MAKKIDWQNGVRYQMKKVAEKEGRLRAGSKHPPFLYRWEHVKQVVRTARLLAKKEGGDLEIVVAAAWLHDVCKLSDGENHAAAGAKFARKYLPTTDFPKQKIEPVAHAIAVHTGLWRDEPLKVLEAQILWDADKLTKIGLTAALHWMGNHFSKEDTTRTGESVLKMLNRSDFMEKTVSSFHTPTAQAVGTIRYAAYQAFCSGLEAELAQKDL